MAIPRRLRCFQAPETIKFKYRCYGLIALLVLIVGFFVAIAGWCSSIESEQISTIYSMYEELKDFSDFEMLTCSDGALFTVVYDNDGYVRTELPHLPNCIHAMESGKIKGAAKIEDDIFFITKGYVDNYSGYVLSEDTRIDMNTIFSLDRKIQYERYGLFCFAFSSMN